jgi:hypothetical protein
VITDATLNPPSFRWDYRQKPDCSPSGFRVEISTTRNFNNIVASKDTGPAVREWTPSNPLPNCQSYFWRVVPKRSDGSAAPPSEVFTLEISARCP